MNLLFLFFFFFVENSDYEIRFLMIQWGSRWPVFPPSVPLAQLSLSHFLFGLLFCVCSTRAGHFLFVLLQEWERCTLLPWRILFAAVFWTTAMINPPPPNHPSLHKEVNPPKLRNGRSSWEFFFLWHKKNLLLSLCGMPSVSFNYCWRRNTLIHPRS